MENRNRVGSDYAINGRGAACRLSPIPVNGYLGSSKIGTSHAVKIPSNTTRYGIRREKCCYLQARRTQ